MKNYLIYILLAFMAISCEEVIEIELNEAERKWVVEGQITDQIGQTRILLSQSGNYFEPGEYPKVSNANVRIYTDQGDSWNLEEQEAGMYTLETLEGIAEQEYHLEVDIAGELITGSSTLMQAITLDSVSYEYRSFGLTGDAGYRLNIHFQDPPNVATYLRIGVSINGAPPSDFYLYDDGLTDGQEVEFPLFGVNFYDEGDELELTVMTLDALSFLYFSSLDGVQGPGPATTAPANPPSNLGTVALGYFGAFGVTQSSVKIE